MPKTDYTACKPDHRMMRVEMTPKMREIAEQIAALQAQYRKLEEAEQRRRETAPKDWRETVDGKPLPVVPVTPEDRYAVNMAKIQQKIDQAKKKPETELT